MLKNRIDRLDGNQKRLERRLENKKSQVAYVNSKIEAKIIKLQEIAFKNRTDLEKFENEINLKLDRNAAFIRAEASYAQELGKKYELTKKKGV